MHQLTGSGNSSLVAVTGHYPRNGVVVKPIMPPSRTSGVSDIRVGHLFKGPTLVFSVPKWMVRALRYCGLRVLE